MRWDPWRQLQDDMKALNHWFDGREDALGWQPSVDVFEDANGVTFKFEVPEIDPKDIDVKLENGVLTVKGERKLENEDKRDGYRRLERSYGAFVRSFSLPQTFDYEKVTAETKHGVLRIWVPRREETKPRSIQVKVN
jgi:HSP20 family protein